MSSSSSSLVTTSEDLPFDGIKGLKQNWRSDLLSGLLVSLIALPLCLGIAMASGFPAFGGLVTAIIGGLIVGPLCGSQLTIKGPAAGLIAIAVTAVEVLGKGDNFAGYKMTLAVIVVASVIQMLFAMFKLGRFGDFFPAAVVHGMLAAIGVIIFSKQVHVLLGVKPLAKEPLGLLAEIPHSLVVMNPDIALVGAVSIVLVLLASTVLGPIAKYFPGPLMAVLAGVGLCLYFDLTHKHSYTWYDIEYELSDKYLVSLPTNFLSGFTFPDFSQIFTLASAQFILMFSLIGSLESLLTVKAVDAIDPWQRKSDMNRDLFAVGFGNALCGLAGGLPMISEVVRSYANLTYGAKTRWANAAHGLCILFYVVVFAGAMHYVPVAALAGVLCVTGYRLASPSHFRECREIGPEQLIVFTTTIIATLLTDLLVGVGIGILVEYLCVLLKGAPFKSLIVSIRPPLFAPGGEAIIRLPRTCFFGNVVGLKRVTSDITSDTLTLDFAGSVLVDHTFMKEVRSLERQATRANRRVIISGLDRLVPVSDADTCLRSFCRRRQSANPATNS